MIENMNISKTRTSAICMCRKYVTSRSKFMDNSLIFMRFQMRSLEYLCTHRKYLTIHSILWDFQTYFNLFYFSESMLQYKNKIKDKEEKDKIKKLGAICGCELVVVVVDQFTPTLNFLEDLLFFIEKMFTTS